MKKRQLKIRGILLIALVSILGILSLLYLIFCRDGSYNSAPVDVATTNVAIPEEAPADPGAIDENGENGEGDSTDKPISWDEYDPADELTGEKWALTLINKNYPLDKYFTPDTAPVIDGSTVVADTRVAESYKKMYNAAMKDDIILTPYSGYYSYQRQKNIFDDKVKAFKTQGQTEEEAVLNAEKRVGAPGCSEKGAGLSVDVISASAGFASTNEYKWLVENAHKYGFILRYPENKTEITGIIYQPWHWRYVGVTAATEMKEKNLCLEEYLGAVQK